MITSRRNRKNRRSRRSRLFSSQLTAHSSQERQRLLKFYLIDLIRPESILLISAAAEYRLL